MGSLIIAFYLCFDGAFCVQSFSFSSLGSFHSQIFGTPVEIVPPLDGPVADEEFPCVAEFFRVEANGRTDTSFILEPGV